MYHQQQHPEEMYITVRHYHKSNRFKKYVFPNVYFKNGNKIIQTKALIWVIDNQY